jgi:NADPH:quinone reductase-like Zn-dependent oxidoreductase
MKGTEMKAIVYRSYGGPEVLEVAEVPEPKMMADNVLVRIKAASLNPADLGSQAGVMDAVVDSLFPVIPGWDLAGVVEEAGFAAPGFKTGDEVIGYVRGQAMHYGTYAEKISAEVRHLVRKPKNLSWAEAAGLPLAGLTAYQAIVRVLQVRAGETVLVHAAGGGVGHLAGQIAVAQGARVIGTASEANHSYLESIGVIPVRYGDGLVERMREIAPDGVDAVLDAAGRGVLTTTESLGKPHVRVASVAGSTEYPRTIPVFARLDQADLLALVELAEAGKLRVRVARTYPLDLAAEAQRHLAEGHSHGKVVLEIA